MTSLRRQAEFEDLPDWQKQLFLDVADALERLEAEPSD
jgi:hypothetical protein